MSLEQNPSIAFAYVNTDGTLLASGGPIVSAGRTGPGVYTVVTGIGYPLAASQVTCQVIGGAGNANAQVTSADGITFNVTTFVVAAATDEKFMLTLQPLRT